MRFLAMISLLFSAPAHAAVSSCVLYIENTGATPVSVQAACDGAELKQIFESSGISAGISKGIPYFINKGYTFSGCTDSHSNGPNGDAYSRCIFITK
ncbi:MAG: hypothetical protein ACXVB9_17840 [Bdellovibrionota bacterium]